MSRFVSLFAFVFLLASATGCQLGLGTGGLGGGFLGGGPDFQYYPADLEPQTTEQAAAMKAMAIDTSKHPPETNPTDPPNSGRQIPPGGPTGS